MAWDRGGRGGGRRGARLTALVLSVGLTLAACTPADDPAVAPRESVETTTPATSTTKAPTSTTPLSETEAALLETGFIRCIPDLPLDGLSAEARNDIVGRVVAAGLGSGGAVDPGRRVSLRLHVLNSETLTQLLELVSSKLVCVEGQDAADYVEPGPQPSDGPGWRWLGSATTTVGIPITVATTALQYDTIWQAFVVAHPHLVDRQPIVDLDAEIVVTLDTGGRGIDEGRCGSRFERFEVIDNVVTIDLFSPGGDGPCDASSNPGTFLIALDRSALAEPPWQFSIRRAPRIEPTDPRFARPGDLLAWPLATLLPQSWDHFSDPPADPSLANAVACRLVIGDAATPLVAPEGYAPELLELVQTYVASVEALQAELGDRVPPARSSQMGELAWIVGTPDPEPECSSGS